MQTLALLVSFALTGAGAFICIRQVLAARRWRVEKRPALVEPDYSAVMIPDMEDISPELKESIDGLDAIAHHAGTAVEHVLHGLHGS